uniref:CUB_2 domain-containing protein n=1 Tax=Panagrellus redivivus TaxID=6233 RepID=A0A7E4VUV1_PANRE
MKFLPSIIVLTVISIALCIPNDANNHNLIGFKFVIIAENKCILQFYNLHLDGSYEKAHSTNYPCFFKETWNDFNLHLQSDENYGIASVYQRQVVFYWVSISSNGTANEKTRETIVEDDCIEVSASTLESTDDKINFIASSVKQNQTCTVDLIAQHHTVVPSHEVDLKTFNAVTQKFVTYNVLNDALNVNHEKMYYLVDLKKTDKPKIFAVGKTLVVKVGISYYVVNDGTDEAVMAVTSWPKLDFVLDVTPENKEKLTLFTGNGVTKSANASLVMILLVLFITTVTSE